jgi:hypothetical protein
MAPGLSISINTAAMRKLPLELLVLIFGYIVTPQPRRLLDDIRDFHDTRLVATVVYSMRTAHAPAMTYSDFKIHMAHEVILYVNRDFAPDHGFVHDMYAIWMRSDRFWSLAEVDAHVYALLRARPQSTFAAFWGMMVAAERAAFIAWARNTS